MGLVGFGSSVFDSSDSSRWSRIRVSQSFSLCGLTVMSSTGITEGNNVTFWQRLKKQRHGLGNMALAASTLLLAMRLIDQDKEIQRLQAAESSLLNALRRENRSIQERFATFRVAVAEEIGRAGSRLPPLSTRLQTILDENYSREPLTPISNDEQSGEGTETLKETLQAKVKTSFMV